MVFEMSETVFVTATNVGDKKEQIVTRTVCHSVNSVGLIVVFEMDREDHFGSDHVGDKEKTEALVVCHSVGLFVVLNMNKTILVTVM